MAVNFGDAPHESDSIQDLWYALRETGFIDANGNEDLEVSATVGEVDNSPGDVAFGQATGVAPDTSQTVVSHTPPTGEVQAISKVVGNGSSDGEYELQINGVTKMIAIANQSSPNAIIELPNPIEVDDSDTVEVVVKNTGLETASYNGTIGYRL